ncbi:hypothetical protein GCM10027563_23580 [Parasphingorhabdus pacifica]
MHHAGEVDPAVTDAEIDVARHRVAKVYVLDSTGKFASEGGLVDLTGGDVTDVEDEPGCIGGDQIEKRPQPLSAVAEPMMVQPFHEQANTAIGSHGAQRPEPPRQAGEIDGLIDEGGPRGSATRHDQGSFESSGECHQSLSLADEHLVIQSRIVQRPRVRVESPNIKT